jgi:hypothetical protein
METIKVDNNQIQPRQKDWRSTAISYEDRIKNLPTVFSGAISQEASLLWLNTACKLYPPTIVDRLFHQVSGLGAKDIRTLIAHERKEYFPEDSAGELYNRKLLNTIPAPNSPSSERERILTNVTRSMLLSRYGLDRNLAMEKKMSMTDPSRRAVWLVGNPGMIGTNGTDNFLYDIQFSNNTDEINQGDLIRLHYYDLVANNIGQQPKHLSLVKVSVDPNFAESMVSMSRVSKNAEKMITQMASDFANLPEDKIKVQVHQIEKKPELYREIIAAGQKHWPQILSGKTPKIAVDPPLKMNSERELVYVEKAKSFLAATQTVKAAESARQKTVDEFILSMRGFDISDNFMPPYAGALLRKYDFFDAEAAATYLENNLGIDPVHTRTQEVNVEMLKQSFIRMGGDLTPYYEYGSPDKKSIETVAEQVGFDIAGFYTRQMRAIVNPKTRGPVHDAIKDIRDSVTDSIKEINAKTAQSAIMDNKNLLPEKSLPHSKQKTMKL